MSDAADSLQRFLSEVLRPAVHQPRTALEVAAHHVHGEPISAVDALGRTFTAFSVGEPWGARWDTTWFRFRGEVPADWEATTVSALVHLGGSEIVGFTAEGQIWDRSGTPLQGLHHRHREHTVTDKARGGEAVELYVEAAANPIPPWHLPDWPLLAPDYLGEPMYRLRQAELAVLNREVEALYHDFRALLGIAGATPERSPAILDALSAARGICDSNGPLDERTVSEARAALRPALEVPSGSRHAVTAVGHAHIDSAWLWPVRETRRKCARTFANQLRLMERYPEHRFACSQAAQYQWIKDDYPSLYGQIKRRVADGRWEPVGGMWVEPDSNVPSGESLVRQLVHGKRFFADEFGFESHELWIPDVFGYTAALPQIARQAGIDVFITQKMSWNDTNRFPHSTFWWEGHDGSRLLAHFPPADTYNGDFTAGELARGNGNFRDHDRSEHSLYPYGFGDGGGGPTSGMLEQARRLADAGGLPRVRIGTVAEFVEALRAEGPELATWSGELYLEAHRATLTTHADVKKANRRCEEMMRAAEMWSVAAGTDRRGELDAAWKLLLFNQFHDILPGSSIHWVYEDSARDHAEVLRVAADVVAESHRRLVAPGRGGPVVAFNPASHDRREVVETPDGPIVVSAPGCGWAPVGSADKLPDGFGPVTVGENHLDNDYLHVRWNSRGLLTSVWDKGNGREVLVPGEPANLFQIHEDRPASFDAWEVERRYLDDVDNIESIDASEVAEEHPLRCGVRFARRFGESTMTQTVRLHAGSRRLEFDTEVDWHERHRFLKVAFPVSIHSPRATFEIQHGYVERPTVENTSWDLARFEVPAQRWADLSETGYGVALLNDCKYGYDVRGHTLRLSLLRGPGYPDPEADQGPHRFRYALLPHRGGPQEGRVAEDAEAFNLPITLVPGDAAPGQVVRLDRPGVSVEAVKWADRADGIMVRICEVWGWRHPVRVTPGFDYQAVVRTDVLERAVGDVTREGPDIVVPLRPFELVTLLFTGSRAS